VLPFIGSFIGSACPAAEAIYRPAADDVASDEPVDQPPVDEVQTVDERGPPV
jgi:hypothetical protein